MSFANVNNDKMLLSNSTSISQNTLSPLQIKKIAESNSKVKGIYGESKILQTYLKEKESKQCSTLVSTAITEKPQVSEKSFINDLNNDKKIASLNETIMKLNGIVEKNMRKIASQEKEIQFISKRLREAEHLNLKMITEMSMKTSTIESLTNEIRIKKEIKQDQMFRRKSKRGVSYVEGAPEIFIKSISDIFIKELSTMNIKANINNPAFEQYFEDIKLVFMPKECVVGVKNVDINISQNFYLKNLLKMYILSTVSSKKFNTSNISHDKAISISLKNTNFGLHDNE